MSRAEQLTTLAYDTLNNILADPKAPAGVRLKAALSVLKMAEEAPEETPEVHNPAQPQPPQTIRHTTPKIGRNETCPCGSNLKYKRCCLNKPAQPPAEILTRAA